MPVSGRRFEVPSAADAQSFAKPTIKKTNKRLQKAPGRRSVFL